MMDAVHRYEGTVNQVLGDGIMALLGAPIGHENHAIRACYAALAMQAALRGYTEEVRRAHGCELRIRVGLNAGEVVVRTISNDLHMDYSAVGQTTHLAARMEQMATPGTIRLTAATLRLVDGLVQVHALGPLPVRGTAIPLLERTVVLSQDADFPVFFRIAAPVLALAYALAGRATDALALLEQVEENQITYAPSLASEEAYLRAGCVEEAHRLTRRTLTNAHDHNRRGQEARALWLLGEIARHRDPSDVVQAEAYYQQALTLTEALGMRPLVAHCHLGLGRLYHQIGRAEQARIALTTAIDLYRAMAMTFWLPQAEAPLAQVEGQ
jgi:tetratricopeptide (TPR) repeat protein